MTGAVPFFVKRCWQLGIAAKCFSFLPIAFPFFYIKN